MNFTTKLAKYDVSIQNGIIDTCEYEGAFNIEWQYYSEFREGYIKELGVYATRVVGVVYENDECVLEEESQQIDSDDKGWSLRSDSSDIEWGNCIQPIDIYVDLKNKQIIVNF